MGEALKAEHLPRVVEAGLVGGDGPRPGGQVLGPPQLLRQQQVAVGCPGVKGQGAPDCNGEGKENKGFKNRLGSAAWSQCLHFHDTNLYLRVLYHQSPI